MSERQPSTCPNEGDFECHAYPALREQLSAAAAKVASLTRERDEALINYAAGVVSDEQMDKQLADSARQVRTMIEERDALRMAVKRVDVQSGRSGPVLQQIKVGVDGVSFSEFLPDVIQERDTLRQQLADHTRLYSDLVSDTHVDLKQNSTARKLLAQAYQSEGRLKTELADARRENERLIGLLRR
jgi:hypothetical protein